MIQDVIGLLRIDRANPPFNDQRVLEALCLAEEKPAESKRLLREAGYPNGFKIELNCPLSLEDREAIRASLRSIGIDLELVSNQA